MNSKNKSIKNLDNLSLKNIHSDKLISLIAEISSNFSKVIPSNFHSTIEDEFSTVLDNLNVKKSTLFIMDIINDNNFLFFFKDQKIFEKQSIHREDFKSAGFEKLFKGKNYVEIEYGDSVDKPHYPLLLEQFGKPPVLFLQSIRFDKSLVGIFSIFVEKKLPSSYIDFFNIFANLIGELVIRLKNEFSQSTTKMKFEKYQKEQWQLMDNLDSLVFFYSVEGNYGLVNRTHCKFFGVTKESVEFKKVKFFPHYKQLKSILDKSNFVHQQNKKYSFRQWIEGIDGEKHFFSIACYPVFETNHKYVLYILNDITELYRSQEKFSKIFNSGSISMVISEVDSGKIVDCNETFSNRMKYSRNEILGKTAFEIGIFSKYSEWSSIEKDLTAGKLVQNRFISGYSKDKQIQKGLISCAILSVGNKNFILSSIVDITKFSALKEELFLTRVMVEHSESYTFVVDQSNGKIIYMNSSMKSFFSQLSSNREFDISDIESIVYPDDFTIFKEAIIQGAARGSSKGKLRLIKGDSNIWVNFNLHQLVYEGQKKTFLVGVGDNITELQLASEKLKQALATADELAVAAEKANRAKSMFLANISHEIRTPMNGIMGITTLLLETELSMRQKMYANTIRNSSESLLEIINNILDISKIEEGKMDLHNSEFDLRKAVNDVITLLSIKADLKSLKLQYFISSSIPFLCIGDFGKIKQILINLIGNAIKFTNSGFINLHIDVEREDKKDIYLHFKISDSGIGIKQTEIDKLFKPFTRINDNLLFNKTGGTGLGLSISKFLVEKMGGTIGVTSEYNKGSTFYFTIKLNKVKKDNSLTTEHHFSKYKYLLIADDTDSILKFGNLFNKWGALYKIVGDGVGALIELRKAIESGTQFNIIFLSKFISGIGPIELAKLLRKDPILKDTLIIAAFNILNDIDTNLFSYIIGEDGKIKQIEAAIIQVIKNQTKKSGVPKKIMKFVNSKKNLGNERILIVEDNLTNQLVARGIVEKLGFQSFCVENGKEAIAQLEKFNFDIVLMDIQMPIMDGFSTTEFIRKKSSTVKKPDIPIVAMTAHASKEIKEKCLQSGMNDYISKPINVEQLNIILNNILGSEPVEKLVKTTALKIETPNTAIFDGVELLSRLLHKEDLANNVMQSFLIDIKALIFELQENIVNKDYERIKKCAHTIKGSSSNVSCNKLSSIAKTLQFTDFSTKPSLNHFVEEMENQLILIKKELLKESWFKK